MYLMGIYLQILLSSWIHIRELKIYRLIQILDWSMFSWIKLEKTHTKALLG